MGEENLFNRYAIALLSLSIEKNEVESFRNEIKQIVVILRNNREFAEILNDSNYNLEEKNKIIERVFASINQDILSYMKIIIRNGIAFYLYEIFKETLYRFDDYLNIEEGKFYCVSSLKDEDIKKAIAAVEKKLNKRVECEIIRDETLIGGFKLVVKDNVFDASLKKRLERLRESVKKWGIHYANKT